MPQFKPSPLPAIQNQLALEAAILERSNWVEAHGSADAHRHFAWRLGHHRQERGVHQAYAHSPDGTGVTTATFPWLKMTAISQKQPIWWPARGRKHVSSIQNGTKETALIAQDEFLLGSLRHQLNTLRINSGLPTILLIICQAGKAE